MTNINCSTQCVHESNGICMLNQIVLSSNISNAGTDCAYFEPRPPNIKKSSKKQ